MMKTAPKMLSFENVLVLRWKICGTTSVLSRPDREEIPMDETVGNVAPTRGTRQQSIQKPSQGRSATKESVFLGPGPWCWAEND